MHHYGLNKDQDELFDSIRAKINAKYTAKGKELDDAESIEAANNLVEFVKILIKNQPRPNKEEIENTKL